MKKLFLLLFLASPVLATDVRVINSTNNPVNVTGSLTTTTVALTTVTFNGVAQPVNVANPISTFTLVNVATVTISGNVSVNPHQVYLSTIQVVGSTVGISGTVPVSGTFFQIVQPVSQAGPFTVSVASGGITLTNSSFTVTGSTVGVIGTGVFNVTGSTVGINGSFNVTGSTVGAIQNGTWQTVPNRPSQGSGRTYKTAFLSNLTANATAYTVTGGKTLFITDMQLSGFNSSNANAGNIKIQDGATTRIPISIPTAGVGALASQVPVSAQQFSFPEPQEYTTNVNINLVTGTITYSFSFDGYEE